jgi:hypothetical protein
MAAVLIDPTTKTNKNKDIQKHLQRTEYGVLIVSFKTHIREH